MRQNPVAVTRSFRSSGSVAVPLLLLVVLVATLAGCGKSSGDKEFAKTEPQLISPEDGEMFDHFPRDLLLTWRRVEGAVRYQVEVQMQNPRDGLWMPTPVVSNRRLVETERMEIKFPGSQPGRWRVTAISENGTRSRTADWQRFEFITGL